MSQLRTAKAVDVGAFPGSTFVVDDTPPIAQCQETQITAINASVLEGFNLIDVAAEFAGIDVAGKKATVTNTAADNGTYDVISNSSTRLIVDHTFANNEFAVTVVVHDAGQAYLTRNESSFQRFTENAGKAHTTKGGQLFVDVAAGPMAGACSDTFDPQ